MNAKTTSLILIASISAACLFGRVEYADFASSRPSEGESRIDAQIDFGIGEMHVQVGRPDEAYSVDLRYNKAAFTPRLDYSNEGGAGRLTFVLKGGGSNAGDNELDVRLNPGAVISLNAETGVGHSVIDLTGMKIENVELDTGVGATELTVLSANKVRCRRVRIGSGVGGFEAVGLGNLNFDQLEFEGGVGGAELDFSGDWEHLGEVSVSLGVGGAQITLPREIGFEIRTSTSFLTGLSLPGFKKSGGVYRSRDYDKAQKKVRMRLEAGIGGVDVSWR